MKKKLFTLIMMLISFSIQIFAQMRDYTAMVVDARNGEILPYASIYVSSEYGTMSNLEGNFTVMANEEDQIKISYIGYQTIVLKASALPSIVKMEQTSTTLEEITVTTAESILDKAAKLLEKDRKQAKGMKRRYFCRTTELIGNKQEMIEAFLEAESAISLNKLSIMGGRRSVLGKENETALYNTNLHYMLEISPAEIESRFWKNVITPLSDKNYKKHYESSYKLFKPKGEDAYYCITLKNKPNNNNRVIEGTLYIKAKDYRLIKFEGTVPFMSMTVESTNQLPENIKLENSFSMDFSYEKEITEVSSINYRMKGKGIECECILYPVDYIAFSDIKTKKIGKNLVGAVDKHSADSLMSKYNNVIKRTQKEEIIASASDGNRKVSEKNTAILDTSHTDNKAIRNYLERLHAFGQRIPQEKVFIHMDNTCYFQGDTIWFSAYTRQTNTGQPSQMSGVLYVELYNHEGYMVERKLIEMSKGRGDGFFALNQPVMYSGFYELRAYTRWQLNWGVFEHKHSRLAGEWFLTKALEKEYYRDYHKLYSRVFPVYDRPEDPENPERFMTSRIMRRKFKDEENIDPRTQTLTLFPEGGNLVADVPCRVAYEATWNDGEWLEGNLQVAGQSVPVVHRGRGVFTITVKEGEEAEAVFLSKDGQSVKAKLPQPRKEGAVLTVWEEADKWSVKVTLSAGLHPDSVGMTVMHEGNLCHFRPMKERENNFVFGTQELKPGVNQVTVFDTQGGIHADRLFFVRGRGMDKPVLSMKTEKEEYKPYEKISLAIESPAAGTPISVAVRDGYQMDYLHDNGNIMTEMLLASEIKGFIPEPGWYFEKDDEQHRKALDLLMMTQGWRRFEWQDMAVKGNWELTQPAEKAPIIMGSVFDFDIEGVLTEKEKQKEEMEREKKKIQRAEESPNRAREESEAEKKEEKNSSKDNSKNKEISGSEEEEKELVVPEIINEDIMNHNKTDNIEESKVSNSPNAHSELDSWKTLQQEFGLRTNLKHEVKVHAELVHPVTNEAIIGETVTQKGQFKIQLPRFYGQTIFHLAAADTTKWKPGEQYTWIQMLHNEMDLPENKRRKFITENAKMFVRVSFPHPNFIKKYNYYQTTFATVDSKNTVTWKEEEDGSTTMNEVNVQEKRLRGLRKLNESQPALLIDGYVARNMQYDAGMIFAPIARLFVGDYGHDAPYIIPRENSAENAHRIYELYGIDQLEKVRMDLVIPEDSAFHPKYLKVFGDRYGIGRMPTYLQNTSRKDCAIAKYGIDTDYCPRLEGSKRYMGSNLPETHIAMFPYPNEDHRVVYRDRRYLLPGFAYPAEFYSPDYSKQTPPDSIKDYRRTLYWNPNLMLDKDGKATVTLYNNARTTQISVDAAGQAADGTLLWGSE